MYLFQQCFTWLLGGLKQKFKKLIKYKNTQISFFDIVSAPENDIQTKSFKNKLPSKQV